jgi:phosphoglycolate phosphatase
VSSAVETPIRTTRINDAQYKHRIGELSLKFPFDIIGFDLDGTLVDTSGDLTAAVNHVLDSVGRPLLSPETVKQYIGGGAKLMLQQGLEATGGIPDNDFKHFFGDACRK